MEAFNVENTTKRNEIVASFFNTTLLKAAIAKGGLVFSTDPNDFSPIKLTDLTTFEHFFYKDNLAKLKMTTYNTIRSSYPHAFFLSPEIAFLKHFTYPDVNEKIDSVREFRFYETMGEQILYLTTLKQTLAIPLSDNDWDTINTYINKANTHQQVIYLLLLLIDKHIYPAAKLTFRKDSEDLDQLYDYFDISLIMAKIERDKLAIKPCYENPTVENLTTLCSSFALKNLLSHPQLKSAPYFSTSGDEVNFSDELLKRAHFNGVTFNRILENLFSGMTTQKALELKLKPFLIQILNRTDKYISQLQNALKQSAPNQSNSSYTLSPDDWGIAVFKEAAFPKGLPASHNKTDSGIYLYLEDIQSIHIYTSYHETLIKLTETYQALLQSQTSLTIRMLAETSDTIGQLKAMGKSVLQSIYGFFSSEGITPTTNIPKFIGNAKN